MWQTEQPTAKVAWADSSGVRASPSQASLAVRANIIFLSCIPWIIATSVQEAGIHEALIAGTVLSAVVIIIGFILYFSGGREISLYLLDAALLLVLAVQLGVSYPHAYEIARNFDFILNSAMAGLTLISIMCRYPFTIQHLREGLPREAWRHPHVTKGAYVTTLIFSMAFLTNTMLYLIPVVRHVWWDKGNALTAVFKVLVPCLTFFLSVLATKLYPGFIYQHLQDSRGFDCIQRNPMALPVATRV